MDEETLDVAPSEDNGNVPLDVVETPSEPAETDTPAEPTETATTEPEAELFELPDGRKVDAGTVAQEYKNLLSDYTRKSQELAKLKPAETLPADNKPTNPLADPNYVPGTYEELAAQIEARLEAKNQEKEQNRIAEQKALETMVSDQLTAVKTLDPNVNENALFLHANKYGFRDLGQAYQNMKDMNDTIKKTQATTAAAIAKRADPVSVAPGAANGSKLNPDDFRNAVDYLRALKGHS